MAGKRVSKPKQEAWHCSKCARPTEDSRRVCWKCQDRPCQWPGCARYTGSPFMAFCFSCRLNNLTE